MKGRICSLELIKELIDGCDTGRTNPLRMLIADAAIMK